MSKGSDTRPYNGDRYRENHDAINWSGRKQKTIDKQKTKTEVLLICACGARHRLAIPNAEVRICGRCFSRLSI